MNIKEIVEKIFQIEHDMELFNKKIKDVYFWELVRFDVFKQISQATGLYDQNNAKLEINLKNVVKYILNVMINIFHKNPFLSPKCDILFFGSPRRKLMEDGLWWDIYSDHIIESLENSYRCLLLEPLMLNSHLFPAKTTNIRYLDLIQFAELVLRNTKLINHSLTKNEEKLLKDIEKHIREQFHVCINLRKLVMDKLLSRKIGVPLYATLIKKTNPKIVIIINSYGNKKSLIEVCKKMSVPVVELQHGSLGKYHVGYSFPCNKSFELKFPDYFLAFGEYWKNIVDFPISKNNVLSVGYPFFDHEKEKYDHEPKINQIVFVSQWTIAEKMSRFAVDLAARNEFPLDIVYKLHPREYKVWREKYPWLKDAGIRVIDDDSVPLHKLLARSKALVGVYSTAVYEGLGMGLKTFLLDLSGIEYMDELIKAKAVTVISTVSELVEKYEQIDEQKSNPAFYFMPNSVLNIANVLDKIMMR